MQFIYRRKINGNPYSCSGWLLVWVWHSDGCSSCFLSVLLNGHINCYTTTMAFFTHNLSFSSLPSGKNVTFLHLCAAGEGVCELRYRTGTDLLCVITSLSARGEISCNIILKYMLNVWEKLSECHNFGLFAPPHHSSCHHRRRFTVCKLRCQLIKIAALRKNVNERSRLSLSVRPRASPSLSAGSLLFQTRRIPLILQVVISSLLIDVLSVLWQWAQLACIHLHGIR